MDDQFLKVRIISPKETVFEGQAFAVSSTNVAGNFDILPSHANFITIVRDSPIVIRNSGQKEIKTFHFPLAIIHAASNKVNIYTDIQLDFGENKTPTF